MVYGGLVAKSAFSKINPVFLDDFFDTKLILRQHPQQVFCYFHHFFSQKFGKGITFSNIWMFGHHHWIFFFRWKLVENLFIKVGHFKPRFRNFRIVHWRRSTSSVITTTAAMASTTQAVVLLFCTSLGFFGLVSLPAQSFPPLECLADF